jgi:hypothetical protein
MTFGELLAQLAVSPSRLWWAKWLLIAVAATEPSIMLRRLQMPQKTGDKSITVALGRALMQGPGVIGSKSSWDILIGCFMVTFFAIFWK